MATENFGPSALATPANAVSGLRLFVSPFLFLLVLRDGATWLALAVWVVLSVSDGLDGYLARRQGITRSGAFLDPLADKMLVLAAMAALVFTRVFWAAPVLLIAGREITVSVYRISMGRRGVSVPARLLAKVKTVVQEVAVGFALLPLTTRHPVVADTCLWAAVVLALASGAQYLLDARTAVGAHAL